MVPTAAVVMIGTQGNEITGALTATQYRAKPGQQLARLERLREIIVGAEFQSNDTIHCVAAVLSA